MQNHEILFRGFHPCDEDTIIYVEGKAVHGRWVEGFYYIVTKGQNGVIGNDSIIMTFKKLENGEIILTGNFSVIPSTVGQLTGLTDKNGKGIFEGDVIKQTVKDYSKISEFPCPTKELLCVVEWWNSFCNCGYRTRAIKGTKKNATQMVTQSIISTTEAVIISTIFDKEETQDAE